MLSWKKDSRIGLNSDLKLGLNDFDIDLSKLTTGVYLYDVSIDGKRVKSDKLNIVK